MTARVVAPGVVVDPEVQFGEPCIEGRRIQTSIIAGRFRSGETLTKIARDYCISFDDIGEALRWELTPYSTRRRRISRALGKK